jgi:hypothetical protein
LVFEVDLTKGREDCGTNFEDCGGDGVTEDKMALVIEGLWEGLVVDESVARFSA